MILNNFSEIELIRLHFIKYPLEKVKEELGNIIIGLFNDNWKARELVLNFDKTLDYYDGKISFHERVKCLIWQPQSLDDDITVFLTTFPDGWPTLINNYFSKYQREIISTVLCDTKTEFPFYNFEYKNKTEERIIQAMKDDKKWEFFEKGLALPFENKEYYEKRKISDRLNNEIIDEYLKKSGIDICDINFWKSRGNAIEFETRLDGK
jgi:hypothetical protein